MSTGTHPLEAAAERALAKAETAGGHTVAHWLHAHDCWVVPSQSRPGETHLVGRVRPDGPTTEQSPKQEAANRRGWWWFTLHCTCQDHVEHAPLAVCWHKAAVRLWQLHYGRRDGRAWGTLPPHSNAVAKANADTDADGVERWKDRDPRGYSDAASWDAKAGPIDENAEEIYIGGYDGVYERAVDGLPVNGGAEDEL